MSRQHCLAVFEHSIDRSRYEVVAILEVRVEPTVSQSSALHDFGNSNSLVSVRADRLGSFVNYSGTGTLFV